MPLAYLTDALNLSTSFPLPVAHPTAWLVLGPATLLTVTPLLSAVDSITERLGATLALRRVSVLAAAAAAFPVLVLFGHPEDVLALALSLYSLILVADGRNLKSAWMMGLSLAVQPLTVVLVPLLAGYLGCKKALPWMTRAALLPSLLVAIVLAADYKDAVRVLLHQPNYPTANANHATPWAQLAPVTGPHAIAAGPGRMVALGLALVLAGWGVRFRSRFDLLVVGAMIALTLRVPLEAVVVPYYLTPALVLAILVASRQVRTLTLTIGAGTVTSVFSFFHYGPWSYWLLTVGVLGLTLSLAASGLPLAGVRPQITGDSGQNPVHEPTRVLGGVQLGQLDGLIDDDADRGALGLGELEDSHAEKVAVDGRHPGQRPVSRVTRNQAVDLPLPA
jgi:hypothetical protein